MNQIPEVALIAAAALGWLVQQARAYKGLNNWLIWAGIGVLSAIGWFWATPAAFQAFEENWRTALVSIITFGMTAAGFGTLSKDAKVAPAGNTK